MGERVTGLIPNSNLRFGYVEVADIVRELGTRHLSGPTADRIMGQALAGLGLLSADLTEEGECLSLRIEATGPIKGLLTEVSTEGTLRGYTAGKILNEFDGNEGDFTEKAMGKSAQAFLVHSKPSKILGTAQLASAPASIADILDQYYNISKQTVTTLLLDVVVDNFQVQRARGLMIQCMPDSDFEVFTTLREQLHETGSLAALDSDDPVSSLCAWLKLGELAGIKRQKLTFGCRCSQERAETSISMLEPEELRDILKTGEEQQIHCHMCGNTYKISCERITEMLLKKTKS